MRTKSRIKTKTYHKDNPLEILYSEQKLGENGYIIGFLIGLLVAAGIGAAVGATAYVGSALVNGLFKDK